MPSGLISCRIPSWGSPSRAFPSRRAGSLSGSHPLLPLDCLIETSEQPRLFPWRLPLRIESPRLFRAPRQSWIERLNPFLRARPQGGSKFPSTRFPLSWIYLPKKTDPPQQCAIEFLLAPTEPDPSEISARPPRLQSFTPSESPYRSMRGRPTPSSRCPPGSFAPSRVLSLPAVSRASSAIPSRALPNNRQVCHSACTPGSCRRKDRLALEGCKQFGQPRKTFLPTYPAAFFVRLVCGLRLTTDPSNPSGFGIPPNGLPTLLGFPTSSLHLAS